MLVDYPSELLPLYLYILEWEKCTLQSLLFLQAEKYVRVERASFISLNADLAPRNVTSYATLSSRKKRRLHTFSYSVAVHTLASRRRKYFTLERAERRSGSSRSTR
jgi:hypothetical protein